MLVEPDADAAVEPIAALAARAGAGRRDALVGPEGGWAAEEWTLAATRTACA